MEKKQPSKTTPSTEEGFDISNCFEGKFED